MLVFFLFLAFDELVCVVDREPITKEELSYVATFYPGFGYGDLLDKMINDKIIQYLAAEETLKVNEDEISEMRGQLISNTPGLTSMLEENEYLNEIYNEQIKVQLYTNKLMGVKFGGRLRVSPAEIQKFYQSYKDSLVMPETVILEKMQVPVLPQENNRLLGKAEKILAEYEKGEDFASLVRRYSDDVSTIPYGGKMGKLAPSDIPPHLTGILELEVGKAGIFESPTGYHIIKLDERQGINLSISQILLEFDFKEEEVKEAEKRALEIKEEWSLGDSSLSDGIEEMGPFPVYALPQAILSLIDTMDLGQISSPILEGMNFHLFKVKEREESRMPEFSDIKDRLSSLLMQRKMMKLLNDWLEEERKHIFIKKL
jgi:peptidyl-prolyl cis-trans isomerase SurA